MGGVLQNLWTKSPRDYWRRLSNAKADGTVWTAGKHRQWNRLPYYLRAFQAMAQRHGQTFDLAGRKVLEVGAGQVLGFAPFAIIEGAAATALVDPGYVELREYPHFQSQYLFPLYSTHSRLYSDPGPRDFAAFLDRVRRLDAHACGLEQLDPATMQYDLMLSKSSFGNLPDINQAVDVCHEASTPGSLHCHYLDFTIYRPIDSTGSPFGALYDQSRESNPIYFKNGGELNFLRPSEVVAAFQRRFREVHFLPLDDYRGRISFDQVHPSWKRFPAEELAIANGILLAIK